MSTLTESLAKGLASRFISEHSERAAIVESRVVALTRDIPSSGFVKQAKWQAFARKLSDIHRGSRLSEVEFGSKRKKVVVLHYIGAPVTNPSVDWEEDAVPVCYLASASPRGLVRVPYNTRCFVGKHALGRVFQRLGVPDDELKGAGLYAAARACAVEEFSMLASWSVVYLTLWVLSEELQASSTLLTSVIPSKNGLFFADMSSDYPLLSVRTYVHDRQLTEPQKKLKTALLAAIPSEEADLIECGGLTGSLVWESGVAVSLVHWRLKTFFQAWIPLVLAKIADTKEAQRLSAAVGSALSLNAPPPPLVALYEQVGILTVCETARMTNGLQAFASLCNEHGIVDDGTWRLDSGPRPNEDA